MKIRIFVFDTLLQDLLDAFGAVFLIFHENA